nr:transposase [Corynebacterium amycolatum]
MPEIGIKTTAQILLSIGDGSDFASSDHLAAYAGIAPVTRKTGLPTPVDGSNNHA